MKSYIQRKKEQIKKIWPNKHLMAEIGCTIGIVITTFFLLEFILHLRIVEKLF